MNHLILNLNQDWNLISGVNSQYSLNNISDPDNIIIPGTFYGLDGSYVNIDTLLPGSGCWVRCQYAGSIEMSNEYYNDQSGFTEELDNSNSLKFTNANGKISLIYFGSSIPEEIKKSYKLPPLPPIEVLETSFLDSRFSGDWKHSENGGIIEVRNINYPLIMEYNIINGGQWDLNIVTSKQIQNDIETDFPSTKLSSFGKIVFENSITNFTLQKIENVTSLPSVFFLYPSYPNPFNQITTIRFDVPKPTHINLVVYDISGRKVNTLISRVESPGFKSVKWDGKNDSGLNVATGLYFYKLETETFSSSQKMLLLK